MTDRYRLLCINRKGGDVVGAWVKAADTLKALKETVRGAEESVRLASSDIIKWALPKAVTVGEAYCFWVNDTKRQKEVLLMVQNMETGIKITLLEESQGSTYVIHQFCVPR